jgi:hypothetical protein
VAWGYHANDDKTVVVPVDDGVDVIKQDGIVGH